MRNNCKTKIIIDINLLLDKADPAQPNSANFKLPTARHVLIFKPSCVHKHIQKEMEFQLFRTFIAQEIWI